MFSGIYDRLFLFLSACLPLLKSLSVIFEHDKLTRQCMLYGKGWTLTLKS